ncbi:S-adenosyl-L-methionine-dependent methyltransferase [Catenaria anguillulae PL171]|uniref:S-adenosyl-L-methionine-dependent methyltransferase n=1 Tax=Catenaria anguillulae PL171 TaxID=765915 RepID=A0A1Y2I0N6_9FUNG|nr:S-adenosyl-L-methionine-dependent methyltransferase [Catenaria anguillulae PL171]
MSESDMASATDAPSPAAATSSPLPPLLVKYLNEHSIPLDIYSTPIPRFFRLHPAHAASITPADLAADLATPDHPHPRIDPVRWLPGHHFFSIPSTLGLRHSRLYQTGRILGMDVSSAVAVHALDVQPTDHVLDLCCAPGAKLTLIAQLLNPQGRINDVRGSVTGVDVSAPRLAVARALIKKHAVVSARLFEADGTRFSVRAPRWSVEAIQKRVRAQAGEELEELSQEWVVRPDAVVAPFHAPKILRKDPQFLDDACLYDKVLVDAECTHDGSVAHILKYRRPDGTWASDDDISKLWLSELRQAELEQLQRNLLANGWALLKPGGVLVYSTCSLTWRQNEGIVDWFLQQEPEAEPVEIETHDEFPTASKQARGETTVCEFPCLRLDPVRSGTSGMFVVKLRKKASETGSSETE